MKRSVRFFRLGLYLLLMVVVALTATAISMRLAIHGAEVSVPDLSAMTLADARQHAQSSHLSLEIDGRYYSNDIAAGHVLTQLPASGTVVRRGWRIRVSESLGPRKVAIPDVVGQPERISSIRIRRLGLELGSVAHIPFPSDDPDVVLAQDPPANSADISRPRVSLLIADPPAASDVSYVMPDLVGQMVGTATDAIARAGLHVAPQLTPSSPAPVAADLSSSAATTASGVSASATTPTPTAPIAVPDNTIPQPTAAVPAGTILSQSPAAGSRVDAQTLIRLTVLR